MKSLVRKSLYAALGLLGTGKGALNDFGRELSKRAALSEKEGEKIARKLRKQSERAISEIQATLTTEVTRAVDALHAEVKKDLSALSRKKAARPAPNKGRHRNRAKRTEAR